MSLGVVRWPNLRGDEFAEGKQAQAGLGRTGDKVQPLPVYNFLQSTVATRLNSTSSAAFADLIAGFSKAHSDSLRSQCPNCHQPTIGRINL